ncbi:MAG: Uma2 family endonuclease [Rhodothermales bacterium]|jgi:Uma2 family endonuclease
MLTAQHTDRLTIKDYSALPEGAPYELIDGELVLSPAPTTQHQQILMALAMHLNIYACKVGGKAFVAPTDVKFSEHDVLQPDLLYVTQARLHIIEKAMLVEAPDIVIEILSPSTAYRDLRGKMRLYEQGGVCEYWVVDPEEGDIEIYVTGPNGFQRSQRLGADDSLTSSLLSGFSVPVCEIFS